jgi:hypothetical protein
MSSWQPIETAPKDGTQIDLWGITGEYEGRFAYCWWGKLAGKVERYDWLHDGWGMSSPTDPIRITHWMPLPDAPMGHEWYSREENAA